MRLANFQAMREEKLLSRNLILDTYLDIFQRGKCQGFNSQTAPLITYVYPVGCRKLSAHCVMGTKGREIVGVDVKKLLKLLNKALADEWLAYYQYWVGAKVAKGLMRGPVAAELSQHASEELGHAEKLTERMIQLGGTPLLSPEEWLKETNCGYDAPTDSSVKKLLKQNIKGEQCAIGVYTKLVEFVKDKDSITYNMVLEILSDEVEHEEDLENLLEDMQISGSGSCCVDED